MRDDESEKDLRPWCEMARARKRIRQKGVNHLLVTCYMPRNHLTSVVITGKERGEGNRHVF